jgi:hypothetical protein
MVSGLEGEHESKAIKGSTESIEPPEFDRH